jgi:hypothetical protein
MADVAIPIDSVEDGNLFGEEPINYDDDGDDDKKFMPMHGVFQQELVNLATGLGATPQPPRLRHRTVQRGAQAAALPPPPPPPPARPSRLRAVLVNWYERYELWRFDAGVRWSARIDRFNRARGRFLACVCMLVTVIALVAAATAFASRNERTFIVDTSGIDYARHGHDGVNLEREAEPFLCTELAAGALERPDAREPVLIARMRTIAETLMARDDDVECVCGPMFRVRRRYLVLRIGSSLLHAYNAVEDTSWTGALDDGRSLNVSTWLVHEQQRMLFPERIDTVPVLRRSAIRLAYRDEHCAAAAVIVQHSLAFCAQACLDLFNGHSVYSKRYIEEI